MCLRIVLRSVLILHAHITMGVYAPIGSADPRNRLVSGRYRLVFETQENLLHNPFGPLESKINVNDNPGVSLFRTALILATFQSR
ncbi:hypothetical protein R3P38DRAFT_1722215 [Favolaschia claudopus]|uniref:Secreted protein n=1 Tax=Favolaschia claudopus TaxID=2862362 RepID=A0AAW0ABJ1_9AGAR